MGFADFHNTLRILLSIDMDEFSTALYPERDGSPPPIGDPLWDEWYAFRDDPFRWFIREPDERAQAIWTLIETRH